MDWSLVLLSQGIENTVDFAHHDGWGLWVAPDQYQNALKSIELYQLENRGWPWQKRLPGPEVLFDWASLAWVFLIALFFWLETTDNLKPLGVLSAKALPQHEWWRFFTAVWLHADLGHMASNAVFGFLLLGLAMGRYGTGAALLAAYSAGVIGNLCTAFVIHDNAYGLGASGMVMGALGLLAAQSISHWGKHPHNLKLVTGGIAGGIMLFALLGLTPGTNVLAHFAGFISGVLLGVVLSRIPSCAKQGTLNLALGLIFTALVILPWWLAIKAGTK